LYSSNPRRVGIYNTYTWASIHMGSIYSNSATNRDKRVTFLSGLVLPTGIKGLGLLSRVEPPTGTKGGPFVQVGTSNRDKRPLSPPLARLAFGPGTKATNCPGPKGNRDKWPGTKAYSVVVRPSMPSTT